MKGDFTRRTFRPDNHYSGVLLQQGRVQIDADFNEQVEIGRHRAWTTTMDVVGACGAPYHDAGFQVSVQASELQIGAGRYYVDGILCQNEHGCAISAQPDLPGVALPTAAGRYVAYLDVWQRHLTALERPALRETALGGPDTATRAKTVWQVRLAPVSGDFVCTDDWTAPEIPTVPARLAAQAEPAPLTTDECLVPPGAGYRRLENQLYRVEIHQSGAPGTATYKWSRDNGTVVARLEQVDGLVMTVSDAGRDVVLGFAADQWVELTDEGRTLRGEPGILVELGAVQGNLLTVKAWPAGPAVTMASFGDVPIVRRWDSPGAQTVTTSGMLDLEDGVQVQFAAPGDYRTGDFWTIPARSLTGTVEWPQTGGGPQLVERQGIIHHACLLGLLDLAGTTWTVQADCRNLFPPLTEQTSLFYVGGGGQEAMPDLTQMSNLLPLDEPLQVGVANGEWPVAGATVRFERLSPGAGRLKRTAEAATDYTAGPIDVVTGADGIARCNWEIDSLHQAQQVQATLRDAGGGQIHLPVVFDANLSVASEVAYDPGKCKNLSDQKTVQAAVDHLAALASLAVVDGDAQTVMPDAAHPDARVPLPQPLRVAVASACGPVAKASVEFKIVPPGAGQLKPSGQSASAYTDQPVTVQTNNQGIASCDWAVDPQNATQQVAATLVDAGAQPITAPLAAGFVAHVSLADQVWYAAGDCDALKDATTVQAALDKLCKLGNGRDRGIYVKEVRLITPSQPLGNDTPIPVTDFIHGVRVVCDHDLDQGSVRNKPVCIVSLELPYPLGESDEALWNVTQTVAFQPLILDGHANSDGAAIFWAPAAPTTAWLSDRLFQVLAERQRGDRVLVRLTLKGNFIWAVDDAGLYLDGNVFGQRQAGSSTTSLDLRTGSGDGTRGGDFEMWFWLVQFVRLSGLALRDSQTGQVLSNPSIVGGTNVQAAITLSGLATDDMPVDLTVDPAGAVTFLDNSGAPVTAVTVPRGQFEAAVAVRAEPRAQDQPVTIHAQAGNDSATATLTVLAPQLAQLTLPTGEVTSGGKVQAGVSLNGPAPTGGISVSLTSDATNLVTVPKTVAVAAGATTATFDLNMMAVDGTATITATLGVAKSGTVTLRAARPTAIALDASTVTGGAGLVGGTITLGRAAPAGGQKVLITPHSTPLGVASIRKGGNSVDGITIAAGSNTGTFQVATIPVSQSTVVTIEAALPGQPADASTSLTVQPVALTALVLPSTTVQGGTTVQGTVRLAEHAPADTVISLSASHPPAGEESPIASLPGSTGDGFQGSVTVPAGSDSATFQIGTADQITRRVTSHSPGGRILDTVSVHVSASYGGTTESDNLSIHLWVLLDTGL